jgi:Zn-dependent protease with chaperone function
MFGNFLYFIVVLLIYSTYQPSEDTGISPGEAMSFFTGLVFVFYWITRYFFKKLEKEISSGTVFNADQKFDTIITRQSIMAVVVFSINIYVLGLPSFFTGITVFREIPTLLALCFIALFIFYLCIIWESAFASQRSIHRNTMSMKEYIRSNISFSIPVLIPWTLLSGIADIINLLPFEFPKTILASPAGQTGYFLVFLLVLVFFAPVLIQRFWGCKPLADGIFRTRIESFLKNADLEYADILHWPLFGGKMITAGVMGIVKKFRYILVTPALLRYLSPEELDAVMAHETGHVKKHHLIFYLFFFVGFMLLSYSVFNLIVYALLYFEPLYHMTFGSDPTGTGIFPQVFSIIDIAIFIIYFRFIFGYFMRNFERQADIFVYELMDDAAPLISSLDKIGAVGRHSPDKPNWHHFGINQRIGYLKKCEADRSWIERHNRKVKKSILIYACAMVLMGGIGYNLNYGEAGKKLSKHFYETVITREIEKTPDNPILYRELGDYYYIAVKDFSKAIEAYEKSIILDPNNPETLNNMAWLYATCEDDYFRNPERALALAKRAADLKKAPHILDTLAESYFVNRQYEMAVETEQRALEIAGRDRALYRKQLEKFEDALNGKTQTLK